MVAEHGGIGLNIIAQKIFQFLQKGQIDEYALATRDKLIDKKISQGNCQ